MDAARAQSQILPQMPDVPVTDHWTLHCGRAQDVLPGEYAGRVNLIVTSPPYDGLRQYGGYMDAWDFDAVAAAIIPTLAPGGVLVWVVADAIVDGSETGTSYRQALHFLDAGLRLHQTLIYSRWSLAGMRDNAYLRDFEHSFVFSRGKPATANLLYDRQPWHPRGRYAKVDAGRVGDKKGTYPVGTALTGPLENGRRSSIWHYQVGKAAGNRNGDLDYQSLAEHPAVFPQDLAADHIRSWTNPGDLVLDPMAGSGTTLRAAVNLNRRAVGVEVNPDYCDLIRRRMAQQTLGL